MSIRRVAKISDWVAGAFVLAISPFAAAQVQDKAAQALPTFAVLADLGAAAQPVGIIPAGDGSYYITTNQGGAANFGSIYKFTPGSDPVLFHDFIDPDGGARPSDTVIQDEQRNLYGTTLVGGNGGCGKNTTFCGVVFKLAPDASETVLFAFTPSGTDGYNPSGRLLRDKSGNLYGTTQQGGDLDCNNGFGCGVVFKLTPDGTYTLLHVFTGTDGWWPNGDLIRDRAGNLYGTTSKGGDMECEGGADQGCGVIFKLALDGTFTIVHMFTNEADGIRPGAGLIGDSAGNLYGTTVGGGSGCCGVVFKITPDGTFTSLYGFKGNGPNPPDGRSPSGSPLYRNPQTGALFGTTTAGGYWGHENSSGATFVVRQDGTERLLRSFGGTDGGWGPSELIKGPGAELIGITSSGWIYSLQFGQ